MRQPSILLKRLAGSILALGALAFAVQGGEYSTLDLIRRARSKAELSRAVDSLNHLVDSLAHYRERLDSDPALEERIVREQFGMVRDKELLYQLVEGDSAHSPKPPGPQ